MLHVSNSDIATFHFTSLEPKVISIGKGNLGKPIAIGEDVICRENSQRTVKHFEEVFHKTTIMLLFIYIHVYIYIYIYIYNQLQLLRFNDMNIELYFLDFFS